MITVDPGAFFRALTMAQNLATANQRQAHLYVMPDGFVWNTLSRECVPADAAAVMRVDYDLKVAAPGDASARPHFELSPNDILAADVIAFWIEKAAINGVSPPKLELARQTHAAYLAWPNRKIPD